MRLASAPIVDIDAMGAAAIDGLSIECVQLEAKPFSGSWTAVPLGPLVMQVGRAAVALMRRIRVPSDKWLFMVPVTMPTEARWNGSAVTGGELMICSPRAQAYAFDPGRAEVAFISVASGAVSSLSSLVENAASEPVGWSRLVRPTSEQFSRLCGMLRQKATVAAASARPVARDAREQRGLFDSLARALSSARPAHTCPRGDIVKRAEDFFQQHVGEPVSIAQLSSMVGVSERSLRNAFYDVSTTSPKRYLRIWQLHQVRRALRASTSDDATVTDVATVHGFFELGRFAGEYKALFGEAPSKTLHRSKPIS